MAASPTHSTSSPQSTRVTFDIPTATPFPRRTDKMSIAQTFHLARRARGKLSSEASRSDHNLRLLVGHANLLDSLMIHLAEAEAEQERWYQNTVRGNEYDTEEYGSLAADYESDTESESDEEEEYEESEEEEEDEFEEVYYEQKRRTVYRPTQPLREAVIEVQEVEVAADYDGVEYEDDEEDDGMFTLTRTTSHRPPSLCSDASDDDEEDDHAPPSPPQPADHHYPMSEKELRTISYFSSTLHDDGHDSTDVLFEDRLLPTMISAF